MSNNSSQLKIVPWSSKKEWELVRRWLFESPYFTDIVKGISRLVGFYFKKMSTKDITI